MRPSGKQLLLNLLQVAESSDTDSIELERVDGRLEVSFIKGGTGFGGTPFERGAEQALFAFISKRSRIKDDCTGKLTSADTGWHSDVIVEEYMSFDEVCFRLVLDPG